MKRMFRFSRVVQFFTALAAAVFFGIKADQLVVPALLRVSGPRGLDGGEWLVVLAIGGGAAMLVGALLENSIQEDD